MLASVIAGAAGGLIAIFWWKASQYFIGAWGGFAFGLWIQCFRDGGLIGPIGYRWIMYIGCALVGFVLCTIPRIHYHVLLISTSLVGASAVMLGVDCYTTAGLKEFYVWNIGFMAMFPKLLDNNIQFKVSQTIQIELGLLAAVAIAGIAVQLRILVVLQRKLAEIKALQKKRDEEAAVEHTERFAAMETEREQWEKDHPTLHKHGRYESGISTVPLMKDLDGSSSPTLSETRGRTQSGLSEFQAASASKDEMDRFARSQPSGALPALDLGSGIESTVPQNFISEDGSTSNEKAESGGAAGEKHALLNEIQTIRRSIEMLRSESSTSGGAHSRRPSLSSKRTLSFDATTALSPPLAVPTHLRPPREQNFRERTHSMELLSMAKSANVGGSIGRPTSTPLTHADWDEYVQDRRLLQPPSGPSAPIQTTATFAADRSQLPQSVKDAMNRRKARESLLMDRREVSGDSSDDTPLAALSPPRHRQHRPQASSGDQAAPVTILPPRKVAAPAPQRPEANRVKTFEELQERHKQKMRGMQAPVTQEAREQADLAAAKERWERNKSLERNVMTRRQQEQAETLAKKNKAEKRRSSTLIDLAGEEPKEAATAPHSRSLSFDKLATLGGGSSKRVSTMKVQDWQKYQQEATDSGYRQDRSPRDQSEGARLPGKGRRS